VSEHVSALRLDELVAEGRSDPHVEGCAECQKKLDALKTEAAASRASFGFSRTRARVMVPEPSRWRLIALGAVPLLAAVLFFFAIQLGQREGERLKGTPTLELITTDGSSVTAVRPGTHLRLKVGAAGFTHAKAFAGDEQLWPEAGADDRLPGTGVVTLPRVFEATPGSVTVRVLLSNTPITGNEAPASVERRLEVLP
jgi:hypothetical protein